MVRHCDNCDMFKSEIALKLTRYSSLGEERISKIGMIRSPLAIVFLWRSFGGMCVPSLGFPHEVEWVEWVEWALPAQIFMNISCG